MILIDTSVWIESTKRNGKVFRDEIATLLSADDVATTDIVIGEILQGSRTTEEFEEWAGVLDGLHYFQTPRDVWTRAARVSFELRRQGMTTALSDVVIATVALDHDLSVYAVGTDFKRIPGLKLHEPQST